MGSLKRPNRTLDLVCLPSVDFGVLTSSFCPFYAPPPLSSKYSREGWLVPGKGRDPEIVFCNACGTAVVDFSKAKWAHEAHITDEIHLKARYAKVGAEKPLSKAMDTNQSL